MTATDSTFIFGSVNRPSAKLFINELPVNLFPNGAFLAFLPISVGDFTFECRAVSAADTAVVLREVVISPYLTSTPRDTVAIDSSYLLPEENLELRSGDYVRVAFKGTPGLIATFTITGLVENAPMTERQPWKEFDWGEAVFGEGKPPTTAEIEGVYEGGYLIPQNVELNEADILFTLQGSDGHRVKASAPGRLTVRHEFFPQIAETHSEHTVARTGPGLGYQLFFPAGIRLWITGKKGGYFRARLSGLEQVWLPESHLTLLPAGTAIPHSTVSVLRTESRPEKLRVKIYLQQKLPFKIEQTRTPSELIVTIYGATSDTDWIRFQREDALLRGIQWSQPAEGVYRLVIALANEQQWGFDPYYEGNDLIIEVKRPPRKLRLKNLLVCVDAGHGPDKGAVGPTRLTEKDANLQLALALKQKLEKKGARVFLTRKDPFGVALSARPKLATVVGADILISLHHNALPDGVNPFLNNGTSTYYYHIQSRPLAEAIHRRMLQKLKLPDFGLYYDNLTLCRPTQMPAILLEPAFIMHPEGESLIKTAEYKKKTAEAIVKGIEDFLKASKQK